MDKLLRPEYEFRGQTAPELFRPRTDASKTEIHEPAQLQGNVTMADNSPDQKKDGLDVESLKKTTRIFLDDALIAKPAPKKTTTSLTGQADEKKATGPIMGIPTHTAPIPQTIRLKRPATSPVVISPVSITTAPTVVKVVHPKSPTAPVSEAATVIKKIIPQRPLQETSRIILDLGPQAADSRPKTAPISGISPVEPTPGPKTIRLKRPSAIIPAGPPGEMPEVPADIQAAKKSETAKIELPRDIESQTATTQRKTIKIKRTDRNVIARTVKVTRQPPAGLGPELPGGPPEVKPPAEPAIQKEKQVAMAPGQDEPLPAFSILAGLTAACLALLVYLLAAQALGPELLLPVPPAIF